MTEEDDGPKEDSLKSATPKDTTSIESGAKAGKAANWALRLLLVLLVFLLGAAATVYFLPAIKGRLPLVARLLGDTGEGAATVTALEESLARHSREIAALKAAQARITDNIDDSIDARLAKKGLGEAGATTAGPTDAAITARLDELAVAQRRLRDQMAQDDSRSDRVTTLLNRVNQLEAALVPLSAGLSEAREARDDQRQLASRVAQMTDDLDEIKNRLGAVENYAARDTSGALLAFRIGALQRKILRGGAIETELSAVRTLTDRGSFAQSGRLQDSLSWLEQHPEVARATDLRADFERMIPDLLRARRTDPAAPWWRQLYNGLRNLVIIRKTDETTLDDSNNDPGDKITQAQHLLARDNEKEAVALLKSLPDQMRRPPLRDWIHRAETRLRARAEADRIATLAAAYYLADPAADTPPPADAPDPDAPDGQGSGS